jgi:predicted GIY-YIG superfamily endonuclease
MTHELLDLEALLAKSQPMPKPLVGIYFLILRDEIVYVGQSTNILLRIAEHQKQGKVFDRFSFVLVPADHLDEHEAEYIVKFSPRGNKRLPSNSTWATLIGLMRILDTALLPLLQFMEKSGINPHAPYFRISDFAKFSETRTDSTSYYTDFVRLRDFKALAGEDQP